MGLNIVDYGAGRVLLYIIIILVVVSTNGELYEPTPGKVRNLRVTYVTQRTGTIGWDLPDPNTGFGFLINYRRANSDEDSLLEVSYNKDSTAWELINLAPGSTYNVSVNSFNDLEDGPAVSVTLHTLPIPTTPPVIWTTQKTTPAPPTIPFLITAKQQPKVSKKSADLLTTLAPTIPFVITTAKRPTVTEKSADLTYSNDEGVLKNDQSETSSSYHSHSLNFPITNQIQETPTTRSWLTTLDQSLTPRSRVTDYQAVLKAQSSSVAAHSKELGFTPHGRLPTDPNSPDDVEVIIDVFPGNEEGATSPAASTQAATVATSTITTSTKGPDVITDVDLLSAVRPSTDNHIYMAVGLDSIPAFGFAPAHSVQVPYRLFLPQKFPADFAILASVRPDRAEGGYLFAIVGPYDDVVELGVELSPGEKLNSYNISLIYSNLRTDKTSKAIASFPVPDFRGKWLQFSIKVQGPIVTLFLNCQSYQSINVGPRNPPALQFDTHSKLYIGQAGMVIGRQFIGAMQELKIYPNPDEADQQCRSTTVNPSSPEYEQQLERLRVEDTAISDGHTSYTPSGRSTAGSDYSNNHCSCPAGPPGPQGYPGREGPQGPIGPPGSPGVTRAGSRGLLTPGPRGPQGPRGAKGHPGLPGLPAIGEPGPKGDSGIGYPGAPGPSGPPGKNIKGSPGYPGRHGSPGRDGTPGQRGPPGQPGPQGYSYGRNRQMGGGIGLPGPPGPRGEPGSRGYPGPPGAMGPPGRPSNSAGRGYAGPKGDKGDRGVGYPGPPGARGAPGGNGQGHGSNPVPLIFESNKHMVEALETTPVGCLAFSKRSESLFVRVATGWREVQLGKLIEEPLPDPKPLVQKPQPSHNKVELPPSFNQVKSAPPSTVTYRPAMQNDYVNESLLHLIALNQPRTGNIEGVRGADFACYDQARQAGYTTTFRAFLSSKVQDLDKIVHYYDKDTPVVNINNELLYPSWSALFRDGGAYFSANTPIYSFDGRDVMKDDSWPDKHVWHGSDNQGIRQVGCYCNAWRSSENTVTGVASSLSRGTLLGQDQTPCSRELVVLCIENMSKFHLKQLRVKRARRKKNYKGFKRRQFIR